MLCFLGECLNSSSFYSQKPAYDYLNSKKAMDKLNEFLQTLITSCGYELHLEPNKPPYMISSAGVSNIQNAAILGTQISQLVFPLIPASVRTELPDKDEVQFVHPHNLGKFNFTVRKSPAGFNVTISPILDNYLQSNSEPSQPQNELVSPTFSTSQPSFTQPQELTLETTQPPVLNFENLSTSPQIEPQTTYHSSNLIVEEPHSANELVVPQIKVETASVNDPEFITTFSDTSTYEPPGKQYDYVSEVEIVSTENKFQPFETPQVFESPQIYETPQYTEPYLEPQANQIPQIQGQDEVVSQFQPVQQPQFVQESYQVPQPQEFYQPQQQPQFVPQFQQMPQFFAPPPTEPEFVPAVANPQARSKMDSLFYKMAEIKSSDLHLSVSMPPMVRKDGRIAVLDETEATLDPETMRQLLTSIMPEKNQEEFARRHDTDFAYEIEGLARFRANIFMDRKGMGGVFRIIPSKILTAEDLGLSKHILDLCDLSKGLVVVTGPTGSGKSTTLCAMIDHINRQRDDHLITIEDPIEFTHENKKCLVNQREVHNHTDSFKDALRAALREDPDILLVGEMRDLETISIAIETAETGHLVFGTLHTTTAASTIDRIIDQFPADRQQQIRVMLSESLKGVIAQTLLPKKGGGRVAALEILIVTPAISNLIREGKTFQIPSAMQTGKNVGMVMLNDALFAHVQKGLVEPRDAYIKAVDKVGFEAMLTKNGFRL